MSLITRMETARESATFRGWVKILRYILALIFLWPGAEKLSGEFFRRSAEMAPESSLATAAEVGAAEALLRLGNREQARAELERARRAILAGARFGNAALLQRIHELDVESTAAPGPPLTPGSGPGE